MFDHHIKQIETPDFQIQFVAVSGFSVLELVLSTHANVNGLLADVASGQVRIQEVYERILHLLQVVLEVRELSYDGSIVVYLYCLAECEANLAYEASLQILDTKGLFWSRQLARAFAKSYLAQQFAESVELTSEKGEPVPYTLIEHKLAEIHSHFRFSLYPEAVEVSPTLLGSYADGLDSSGIVATVRTSFRSPSARRDSQGKSNSVQQLEIAGAR